MKAKEDHSLPPIPPRPTLAQEEIFRVVPHLEQHGFVFELDLPMPVSSQHWKLLAVAVNNHIFNKGLRLPTDTSRANWPVSFGQSIRTVDTIHEIIPAPDLTPLRFLVLGRKPLSNGSGSDDFGLSVKCITHQHFERTSSLPYCRGFAHSAYPDSKFLILGKLCGSVLTSSLTMVGLGVSGGGNLEGPIPGRLEGGVHKCLAWRSAEPMHFMTRHLTKLSDDEADEYVSFDEHGCLPGCPPFIAEEADPSTPLATSTTVAPLTLSNQLPLDTRNRLRRERSPTLDAASSSDRAARRPRQRGNSVISVSSGKYMLAHLIAQSVYLASYYQVGVGSKMR